jgi:selenocysteine-specific elongation factor
LIEQGGVIDLSSDVVVSKDASEQMRNKVVEFIARQGTATASELRQHLGTSRRVIIPFLEYLDRNGVTRRAGDKRVLVK